MLLIGITICVLLCCICCSLCTVGIGGFFTMNDEPPINCKGNWEEDDDSKCSKSCGTGGKKNAVYKVLKDAKHGGKQCEFADGEKKSIDCFLPDCIDCKGRWDEEDDSKCTKTCGTDGKKNKIYKVLKEAGKGGKDCDFSDGEKKKFDCMLPDCCKCDNGTAVMGAQCTTPGANICDFCDVNYGLVNKKCVKVCTCDGGTAASGDECPKHKEPKCVSCDLEGFKPSTYKKKCVKECICPNGTPVDGDQCEKHGDVACAKCDNDYILEDGKCIPQCKCETPLGTSVGIAAKGDDCPTAGQTKCTQCTAQHYVFNPTTGNCDPPTGFYLGQDGTLKENICKCNDNSGQSIGNAAKGEACPIHNSQFCTKCMSDKGYFPKAYTDNGHECALKECTCQNGTGATGTDCPDNGNAKCTNCSNGYYLKDDKECLQKVCKCDHGTKAVGTDCLTHDSKKCLDCKKGYTLNESDTCIVGEGTSEKECTYSASDLPESVSETTHRSLDYKCSKSLPYCHGYKLGHYMGTCQTSGFGTEADKEFDNMGGTWNSEVTKCGETGTTYDWCQRPRIGQESIGDFRTKCKGWCKIIGHDVDKNLASIEFDIMDGTWNQDAKKCGQTGKKNDWCQLPGIGEDSIGNFRDKCQPYCYDIGFPVDLKLLAESK